MFTNLIKTTNPASKKIILQLGDVIRVFDDDNQELNQQSFVIDYIDSVKMKWINTDTLNTVVIPIPEKGNLGVDRISLISRSEFPGYARQNELLPGTWITLYFGGEVQTILTAEITNLEEDMIEIKTYPDNETLYIDFDYKGIPEDLHLETIQIRKPPSTAREKPPDVDLETAQPAPAQPAQDKQPTLEDETPQPAQDEQPTLEDETPPPASEPPPQRANETISKEEQEIAKNTLPTNRPLRLKESDIVFSSEELGPIVQFIDVSEEKKRYSLEEQTNDLLDDLLSALPNIERTSKNINRLHTTIERFIQLRQEFSTFDTNGNIASFIAKGAQWKPLVQALLAWNRSLYWILPVVKNIKKLYIDELKNVNTESDKTDQILLFLMNDIEAMHNLVQQYYSNNLPDEQNKYAILYDELNPHLTPFNKPDANASSGANNPVLLETPVQTNLLSVANNLGDFLSSVLEGREKKFLMTQYTEGLTRLEGVGLYSKRAALTPNDTMSLTSLLFLPEPIIRYSRIGLPGTNLLEKADLNAVSFPCERILSKHRIVDTEIQSWDQEVPWDVQHIQHLHLSLALQEEGSGAVALYPKFLDKIIPKTKTLLHTMEKYIHGRLSIQHILSYFEPFLIYAQDVTYFQYLEITNFINQKISEYNRNLVERERIFNGIKKIRHIYQFAPEVQSVLRVAPEDVREAYHFPLVNESTAAAEDSTVLNNAEALTAMSLADFGWLYQTAISLQNTRLMFSDDLAALFENIDRATPNEDSQNQTACQNYVLVKKYKTQEALEADNHTDIYIDREYDTTQYSLLDDYEKEMMTMPADDFVLFLVKKLRSKMKLGDYEAEYLAETLISGIKKVIDGQYAVLITENSQSQPESEKDKLMNAQYYRRENQRWVLDDQINPDIFTTDANLLCNLQDKCMTEKGECETLTSGKSLLIEESLQDIVNEFDKQYEISKEALEDRLQKTLEYQFTVFEKKRSLWHAKRSQYNNQQYKLGIKMADAMDDIVTSPYAKLLDLILGQGNFIKKQYDIIRFRTQFTRDGIVGTLDPWGEEETSHWFYCKETNVKLLPAFLYELAHVFIHDNENYATQVDIMIAEIGKKSEDGDNWVDKYSGRIIKACDLSTEEGYEDGYKVVTRDTMEQDIGDSIVAAAAATGPQKTETKEGRMVSNIVTTLATNMGIKLDSQMEFIKRNAIAAFTQSLPSKSFYEKKVQELAKKGKVNQPSYNDLYNSTLLYMTLGMFLIAVQVNVPSLKSRRTFPGCVRSFTGFPLEGAGDDSSLQYLACVVKKIKSSVEPYNVLLKATTEFIAAKIRDVIQRPLWDMPDIVRKVQEKVDYVATHPTEAETIPTEYNVSKWRLFLPPLVTFHVSRLGNVTGEFKSGLKLDLDTGSGGQREKLLVVSSKIMAFSLAIQEAIQKCLYKKTLIMKNAANEPFVENACCNESEGGRTALDYFVAEDSNIRVYNEAVVGLEAMLLDVRSLTSAPFLFCRENSKNVYPVLSADFNEETIYRAFVTFCRFNSLLPMHENLVSVCNSKPDFNVNAFSFKETVIRLKQEGRNYNNESMLRLLQIVNRNNRIHIPTDEYMENMDDLYKDALGKINQDTLSEVPDAGAGATAAADADLDASAVIPQSFLDAMQPIMTEEETSMVNAEAVRNIKNVVSRGIDGLRTTIAEFIRKNHTMSGKKYKNGVDLSALFEWREGSKTGSDEFQFVKTFIKNITEVFPNIILHKKTYRSDLWSTARHWDLSEIHYRDITEIIRKEYKGLEVFFDNKSIEIVLNAIKERCVPLVTLAEFTPYFSSGAGVGAFDQRMSRLLLEYYFLLGINQYLIMSDNDQLFFEYSVREDLTVDDVFTADMDEDRRTMVSLDPEKDLTLEGNKIVLRTNVANMLFVFLEKMQEDKKRVDKTFENVMDKVYKVKEREKNMVTDRLKRMSDEERNVDTIKKMNKLGVWNKGLQKGLKKYVKANYDDERAYVENLKQIEKTVKQNNPDLEDDDLDMAIDDYLETMDTSQVIEDEAYDISDMNEDYTDGIYDTNDIGDVDLEDE